jgi:hypothetical protein
MIIRFGAWLLLALLATSSALAQSAAFTYQGRLAQRNHPASGYYDLQFCLTDSAGEGKRIGDALTNACVAVTDGLFTATLDFGAAAFDGSALWLQVGVRTNGSPDPFTLLYPNQPLTVTPYAAFANNAGTAAYAAVAGVATTGTNTSLTGATTVQNVSGGTNALIYATNVVVFTANTNQIVLTGAGTATANGTYGLRTDDGTRQVWTNCASTALLVINPAHPDYPSGYVTDEGAMLYGAAFSLLGRWEAVEGAAPAPFACYLTNVPNVFSRMIMANVAPPAPAINNDIYVDATFGNDLFWQRGRPDLPLRSFQAAINAAGSNDTIRFAPGFYPASTRTLAPGVKMLGAGRNLTIISNSNIQVMGNDSVLRGFTLKGSVHVGPETSGDPPVTNLFMEDLDVFGSQDGLYLGSWETVTAVNCRFGSPWDAYADYQYQVGGRQNYTNAVATFYNCEFHLDYTPGSWFNNGEAVVVGSGTMKMYGGVIRTRLIGATTCVGVYTVWNAGGNLGAVELWGVNLDYGNQDGAAYAIKNTLGARISLHGMAVNTADVVGPVVFDVPTQSGLNLAPFNTEPTADQIGASGARFWNSNGIVFLYLSADGTNITTRKQIAP